MRVTSIEGGNKRLKLGAAVVDVEFTLDTISCCCKYVAQRVAQYRVAGAAIVDRTGGIGADKFDLPILALSPIDIAKLIASPNNRGNLLLQPGISKAQIDKAGACQFRSTQQVVRGEMVDNRLGNLPWVTVLSRRFSYSGRSYHRHIRAVIAMFGLLGALNINDGQVEWG